MNQQIESYVSSYNSAGNQRILALFSILLINFVLFLFQSILSENKQFSMLLTAGAIVFAIFSRQLLHDLYLIHDSKFRVLMKIDDETKNAFQKEWEILSDSKKTVSPIFNSHLERYQAYFFIVLQCLSFMLNLAERLS